MNRLAMFPLESPLLPGATMQLVVFEPRYREMVADLLAADAAGDDPAPMEFGTVMIERGREVGGGDVRTSVGTRVRIADLRAAPDGRYALAVVGVGRLRVVEWLADDPYPQALVEAWPDEPNAAHVVSANMPVGALIERVTAVLTDLGEHGEIPAGMAPPTAAALAGRLDDDVTLAVYQLASISPFGPADRARLLATPSLAARVTLFGEVLDDFEAAVKFRRS